jgi:hypothetical protein
MELEFRLTARNGHTRLYGLLTGEAHYNLS